MTDFLDQYMNVLQILIGLVKFFWGIYFSHKSNHVFDSFNGTLNIVSLNCFGCVLDKIEIQKLAQVINEDEWIDLICQTLVKLAIFANVDKSEVLSDPGEESINLLNENLRVLVCLGDCACDKDTLKYFFEAMLF
jgi:hypothetical protein